MESSSSFFSWHTQSVNVISGCKALCIVWSICWSSFLVHFKICPEYLMRGTTEGFFPLMIFLRWNLVSSSFLVLLRYSFFSFFFFSSLHVWWVLLPIFPRTYRFLFRRVFWFYPDLVVLFLPSYVPLFIIIILHFFFQNPSLYIHYISSLSVLGFSILSRFGKQFKVVHVH